MKESEAECCMNYTFTVLFVAQKNRSVEQYFSVWMCSCSVSYLHVSRYYSNCIELPVLLVLLIFGCSNILCGDNVP